MSSLPRSASFANRHDQRVLFLNTKLNDFKIVFLASDMSTRSYYRVFSGGKAYVLMDDPDKNALEIFVKIAQLLKHHNVKSPDILNKDFENGFLLLEDFGDATFTVVLNKTPNEISKLYDLGAKTLITLQHHVKEKPTFLKEYSKDVFLREVNLFMTQYWRYVNGAPAPEFLCQQWEKLWDPLFEEALSIVPQTLVLRDYHVDNLMLLDNGECGVLDFQDALWGPVVYDVVSLTEDARFHVPEHIETAVWDQYLKNIPCENHAQYKRAGDIISAGRHAKILGVFSRYFLIHENDSKLKHIPHVMFLLRRSCERANLKDVLAFLDQYFPRES